MHHFTHDEKLHIYRKIHDALKSGGTYIECDYMCTTQAQEDGFFAELARLKAEQRLGDGWFHFDVPCTVENQIKLLKAAGVTIQGKRAVVIGRSNIVGLPVSKLLLDENATVTIAHSRTANLPELTRQAEILVVAIGRPKFVTADMVSEGTVVIDVGVNRDPETGKLCGDVDFAGVEPKASVITPVPGGVGPMTICCLMENTIECFLRRMSR